MKIVVKNTKLVFKTKKEVVVVEPTSMVNAKSGKGSLGYYIESNQSYNCYLYNVESCGLRDGQTIHILTSSNISEAYPAVICFDKITDLSTGLADMMNANCGSIITGTPIDATYSKCDQDFVIPTGTKTIAVIMRNTKPSFAQKVTYSK